MSFLLLHYFLWFFPSFWLNISQVSLDFDSGWILVPCWMEAPWLPKIVNMLKDIPGGCPVVKDLIVVVSVGKFLKGVPYLHLTLWLLRYMCCTDMDSLPQSVRQWWGHLKYLQWRSMNSVGKNGHVGVPINAMSAPKLAEFLVHLFRVDLAWHRIDIYHCGILASWNLIIITKPPLIQSSLNWFIIFFTSTLLKHFDPVHVEYLLLLLMSWAPTSH